MPKSAGGIMSGARRRLALRQTVLGSERTTTYRFDDDQVGVLVFKVPSIAVKRKVPREETANFWINSFAAYRSRENERGTAVSRPDETTECCDQNDLSRSKKGKMKG